MGITAGETKNPSKNMPRVVKMVFWRWVWLPADYGEKMLTCFRRILFFYVLSILLIGLNGQF